MDIYLNENRLFSSEISWDFSPDFGFPFEYGIRVFMGLEPEYCLVYEEKKWSIVSCSRLFGSCILRLDPGDRRLTIGVDREGEFVFLTVGEGMDNPEEFYDIVRTISVWSTMEYLGLSVRCHDSLVFTPTGYRIPGTIDTDTLLDGGSVFSTNALGYGYSFLSIANIVMSIVPECYFTLFMTGEWFVEGSHVSFDGFFAFFPIGEYSRSATLPYGVVFLFWHK